MSMIWMRKLSNLPMIGAKRHEFPMIGSSFGPGISEYGRVGLSFDDIVESASCLATLVGKILMADENVVRFTSELAAVRAPIFDLVQFKSVFSLSLSENWKKCTKIHVNSNEDQRLRTFSSSSLNHTLDRIYSLCPRWQIDKSIQMTN